MLFRVATPGRSAFQLRPDEAGISAFIDNRVDPPLSTDEILVGFRPGSIAVQRTEPEILAKGLRIVEVLGTDPLPIRLQQAHVEIRPGAKMTRNEFKAALQELE